MSLAAFRKDLTRKKQPAKAKIYQSFFKTGPGEYGEGDRFIGVTVPHIRKVVKKYATLPSSQVQKLVQSPIHEERLAGLLIWVDQYERGDEAQKKRIYKNYLRFRKWVNNWDLVDLTAYKIVGHYLSDKSKKVLYDFSRSKRLWERRIAILSTFYEIRQHRFQDTLKISKILLEDREDLIHKAVGWMLREVGKRDLRSEEQFLKQTYQKMPRTMLRYAIEKFPEKKRLAYLNGTI